MFESCKALIKRVLEALRPGPVDQRRRSNSHSARASMIRCRNCGSQLDYTDVTCPACRRKITRFTLST